MTIKQKSFRERDKDDQKGKKRYIERVVEDREASQLIDDFLKGKEEELYEDLPDIRRID